MTAISDGLISTCAGVGGGWKRVTHIDISAGDDCPSGWRQDTYSGVSFCRVVSDGTRTCASANFSTNGISYHRVCGRARGYQKGAANGFHWGHRESQTIDGYYVDGLSITYDNICGRMSMVNMITELLLGSTVHVLLLLVEDLHPSLLWEPTTTVNQDL